MSKAETFRKGDKVSWNSSQGVVVGTVVKTLTSPIEIERHHVAASSEHPQILVESEATGAHAAHKPEALRKHS